MIKFILQVSLLIALFVAIMGGIVSYALSRPSNSTHQDTAKFLSQRQ